MSDQDKPGLYLSGSIEYNKDPNSWRIKMMRALHFRYNVIIPYAKSCPYDKTEPEYKLWIKQEFIVPDMIGVVTSQYVFVKFDPAVFKGAGVVSELTTACWTGKHIVYLLDQIEEKDIPGWTLGCLTGAIKINTIEDAIELYKNLNKPK